MRQQLELALVLIREYREQHDLCNADPEDDTPICPCATCEKAQALLEVLPAEIERLQRLEQAADAYAFAFRPADLKWTDGKLFGFVHQRREELMAVLSYEGPAPAPYATITPGDVPPNDETMDALATMLDLAAKAEEAP